MASSSSSDIKGSTKSRSRLCHECQHVVNRLDSIVAQHWDFERIPFHDDALSIHSSAENGCLLCGQILWILEGLISMKQRSYDDVKISIEIQKRDTNYTIFGLYSTSIAGINRAFFIEVSQERGEDAEMSLVEVKKNGRDALPLVEQWLKSCCTTHDICGSDLTSRFLPTRLVYTKGIPHLCLANNIESCPKYATLSHCWGTLKTLTLLRDNLELFTSRIPSAALNLTFMDAIQVTQTLGIDYIWIDSLCIIQDSPDDWFSESASMSNVYGNSYLNIAATSAADGSHGLFHVRKEYRNQSFLASSSTQGRIENLYHFVPAILFRHLMLEAPLSRRAWVIQERLLSKRTIHFTSTQIFWECNKITACEAFPQQLPPTFHSDIELQMTFRKRPLQDYRWEDIVWLYTRCRLTFERDKLPAISGVAKRMMTLRNCSYVCGLLREESFPLQLCWRRNGTEDGTIPRPKTQRAPSWSWAAIDCAISYRGTDIRLWDSPVYKIYHYIEVDHSRDKAVVSPSFEISPHALLRIDCVFLLRMVCGTDGITIPGSSYLRQWVVDGLAVMVDAIFDYPRDCHDDPHLLLVSKSIVQRTLEDRNVDCLILQKTGGANGQYRRVGYVQLDVGRFIAAPYCDERLFYQRLEAGTLGKQDPLKPDDYVKDLRGEDSKFMYQNELV